MLVHLAIYDIFGREITTLVNEVLSSGRKIFSVSLKNIPTGVYTYRLTTSEGSISKKMIITK
jgi:hypothetical protein